MRFRLIKENLNEESELIEGGGTNAKEVLSTILNRRISPLAKRVRIGWKWWDAEMQRDFIAACDFFNLNNDALDKALKESDPLPDSPISEEEQNKGLDFMYQITKTLERRITEYLNNEGAFDYKISVTRRNFATSRWVGFEFVSFNVNFIK